MSVGPEKAAELHNANHQNYSRHTTTAFGPA
jgi:hypothetical protein